MDAMHIETHPDRAVVERKQSRIPLNAIEQEVFDADGRVLRTDGQWLLREYKGCPWIVVSEAGWRQTEITMLKRQGRRVTFNGEEA